MAVRTVAEIYDEYSIPPWLGEHMRKVTAVALFIFDAHLANNPLLAGRRELAIACLVHDMGNILKFDFERLPPPDGRTEYWKGVKADMQKRYGTNETVATTMIVRELGLAETVLPILRFTSDQEAVELEAEGTLFQKIAAYADQRVSPKGVIPLADRLAEMRARYSHPEDERHRALDAATFRIEENLFQGLSIHPEDVTNEAIAPLLAQFSSFEI